MIYTNKLALPHYCLTLSRRISARMTDRARFEHTLSVAYECLALAEYFSSVDREKLCTAALLHDIAKGLSPEQFSELDRKYSIGFTADDMASPAVLHAKAGAFIAQNEFSADPEICKAIAEHTTGAPDMSLISKILFTSDYVEPTRKWESCKQARRKLYDALSEKNADPEQVLDITVLDLIERTQEHLKAIGRTIHPDSILCKEFILKNLKNY